MNALHRSRGTLQALVRASVAVFIVVGASCSSGVAPATPSPTRERPPTDDEQFTEARVVSVVDGVTIDVEIAGQVRRVRYLGVEVPGSSETSLRDKARQFNSFMVRSGTVELEKGSVDKDEFGRLLRYVYVDGEMINKALLTNGYATVAGFPGGFEDRTAFLVEEESARRDRRGFWEPPSDGGNTAARPTPAPAGSFPGSTLPMPPGLTSSGTVCEFSGTAQAVIKGNIDARTGEREYHVPSGFFYNTTEVSEGQGDRWFCTEDQAVAAGWHKAKH